MDVMPGYDRKRHATRRLGCLLGRARTCGIWIDVRHGAPPTPCRRDDTLTQWLPPLHAPPILRWGTIVPGAKTHGAARALSRDVLRIVTYNIHRGRGLDGRVSLPRIADVLHEIDADV